MKLPEPKYIEIMWLPFERFIHDLNDLEYANPSIQLTNNQYEKAWTKGIEAAAWIIPEIVHYPPAVDNFEHILELISQAANGYQWPEARKIPLNRKRIAGHEIKLTKAMAFGDLKGARKTVSKIVRNPGSNLSICCFENKSLNHFGTTNLC